MAEATKKNDALSRDVTEKQTELDAKLAELGKREEEDERRKHEATEKLQDLAAEIANLRGQREILLAKLGSLQDRIATDSDEGVSGSGRESAGEPSLEQVAKIAE